MLLRFIALLRNADFNAESSGGILAQPQLHTAAISSPDKLATIEILSRRVAASQADCMPIRLKPSPMFNGCGFGGSVDVMVP
jgi:hypothetical protein